MQTTRPWFEKVTVERGHSWTLFDRRLPALPFSWHYHPEYELTLTLNSRGERFIGDHVAPYDDGDLVLVGPNLPHAWQSRQAIDPQAPHRALVLWFSRSWVDGLVLPYPELAGLRPLLDEASRGVSFDAALTRSLRPRIEALVEAPPAQRWLGLVEVLLALAGDGARRPLALHGFVGDDVPRDRARLDRVLTHLHAHYAEPVRLAALAELAAMSESQLQRFFKRCTRLTVSDYLAHLRIGHACALLLEGRLAVSAIAQVCGYSQPSYFTRQFRAVKGLSPSEFRQRFRPSTGEVVALRPASRMRAARTPP